jgi:hypothetical protein
MIAFIYRPMTGSVDQRSRDRTTHCQHLILHGARENGNTGTPRVFGRLDVAIFDALYFQHLQAMLRKSEMVFTNPVYGIFIFKEGSFLFKPGI